MSESVLEFQNVSFSYPNSEFSLVDSLNFTIQDGEFISIVGASGSGKSTLFRLITGLEQETKGSILINGQNLEKPSRQSWIHAPTRSSFTLADHHR